MSSGSAGPDFTAPGFAACYRHPERSTGITCRRCRRPICGECMTPASVGFQCPQCVGAGRASVRQPRTRFGASISAGGGTMTKVLMGVLGAVWLLDLAVVFLPVGSLLVMSNAAVDAGQYWRLVTSSLVSVGLLGLLMNLLVLWLAGRAIEAELGGWRFLVLYLTAGLGGATLFYLLGPGGGGVVTSSAAVVGLLAANSVGKLKSGEDVRPDIGLFVLLLLYSVYVGFASFGWLAMVGGIVVGGLVGWILAYAPRRHRAAVQLVGLLVIVAGCLTAVLLF